MNLNALLHLCTLLLAVPVAAQSAPGQARAPRAKPIALWDPAGPACILRRPGAPVSGAHLPPRYRAPRIDEVFGPGVSEVELLAGAFDDGERPPKVLKGAGGAQFVVVYSDPSGSGFWDPVLGSSRRTAFEFAAAKLVSIVNDDNIVISVDATMPALGLAGNNLASGGASNFWQDPFFPYVDTWYGEPLASHLLDLDPDTDNLDIQIQFNSSWDSDPASTSPWSYALGPAPAGLLSFVTVTLHELIHGLDFSASFLPSGALLDSDPFIFDLFLEDLAGNTLIDLPDVPSTVTGNDVVFAGAVARIAWQKHLDQSGSPPIFAPTPFVMASSLSHFDDAVFTAPWDLMTSTLGPGVSMLEIDPLTRGALTDLGWAVEFAGVYVDPGASPPHSGTPFQPFLSVAIATATAALTGKTDVFLGSGSHDVSSLVIDQAVTLRGWPGPAVLE